MKLLKFTADWCTPCKRQDEEFKKYPVKVSVESININEIDSEMLMLYNVGSIPKMILLNENDEKIAEWTGLTRSKEINEFIDSQKLFEA